MPYIGYAFILLVCLGVILVVFDKVNEKAYPYLLYGIGAGLVLMTSLAGPYIIGSDIHLEYYYAQLNSGMDVLPPLVGTLQGTSIGNTILAPLLGKIIPLLWVYKVVFPLLFASIPIIVYFIFQKLLTKKQAFLASFALISFPAFFMEIPTVVRHITTELLLVSMLFIIIKSNLRFRYTAPLVAILGLLMPLSYYTVTMMGLAIFGTILVMSLFLKYKRSLIAIGLASMIIAGGIYYPLAEDGAVAIKFGHLYNAFTPLGYKLPMPPLLVPEPVVLSERTIPVKRESGEFEEPIPPGVSIDLVKLIPPDNRPFKPLGIPFYKRYGALLESALGVDLITTTPTGKIFRILQWLFILLIPIGLWRLRRNRRYLMFASGGISLLVLILIPGFTGLLSLMRAVHISLLLLAPTIAVALKPKYLLVILIPYFLFTSGFVFEAIQQDTIEEITIPYSYGLSNYRINLGASIDNDDFKVRQYIYDNNLFPTYSDINGANFIGEIIGWRSTWNSTFRTHLGTHKPELGYIFITSRNAKDGEFSLWAGAGLRAYVPLEFFGVDMDKNIIYQSGDSRLLEVLK